MFWLVLVVLLDGADRHRLILLFPNFDQTRATMQIANVVHVVAAYVVDRAGVRAHLSRHDRHEGAYDAMRDGYVDATWAEHHHLRWYERTSSGRARQKVRRAGSAARPSARSRAAWKRARGRHDATSTRRGNDDDAARAGGRRAGCWHPLASPWRSCRRRRRWTTRQKAAAEEKKAKDAAAAEAAKAQQAKAEDRVAARYIAEQKAKGNAVTPQMGPASAAASAAAAPAAAPAKAGATPAKAPEPAAPAKK